MAIRIVRDSFIRPANTDAYGDLDLIANSVTAGSVVPLAFNLGHRGGWLVGLHITKSGASTTNAEFSCHLFGMSPTCANGDNGALSTTFSEKITEVEFGAMISYTDTPAATCHVGDTSLPERQAVPFKRVYALLEADAVYTPASGEVFHLELVIDKC